MEPGQKVSPSTEAGAAACNARVMSFMDTFPLRPSTPSLQELDSPTDLRTPRATRPPKTYANKPRKPVATEYAAWDSFCFHFFLTVMFTIYALSNLGGGDQYYVSSKLLGQAIGGEMLPADEPAWKKTFEDVETVQEFGHWLRGGFMNTFFSKNTFDYEEYDTLPKGYTQDSNGGYVLGYNKIIGGIRIAQLRVKPRGCNGMPPQFMAAMPAADRGFQTPVCYGDSQSHFTEAVENKTAFGVFGTQGKSYLFGGLETDAEPANQNIAAMRAKPFSSWSSMAYQASYPTPAFAVMLNPMEGMANGHRTIHKLITGKYFDRQTRAVLVDVTLLNHQSQTLTWIRMAGEQNKAGGVTTTHDIVSFDPYLIGPSKNKPAFYTLVACAVFYYLCLLGIYLQQLWHTKTVAIAVVVGGLDQVSGLATSGQAVYHTLPKELFRRGGCGIFKGTAITKATARDALSLRCTAVFKQPGDNVAKGEPLYRLEASGVADGGGGRRAVVCVCYSPTDATVRALHLEHSTTACTQGAGTRPGCVAMELSIDRSDPLLQQPPPRERLQQMRTSALVDATLQLGGTLSSPARGTHSRGGKKKKSCCGPAWVAFAKLRLFFAHYPMWRLLELLNIGCFVAHAYMRWLASTSLLPAMEQYNLNGHNFVDFIPCALASRQATRLLGFCVLSLWCRLACISLDFIPSLHVVIR
jgi:hypothetical protein